MPNDSVTLAAAAAEALARAGFTDTSFFSTLPAARGIAGTEIVSGYLIVTYSDGSTENAGFVGIAEGVTPTIENTTGDSDLPAEIVNGFQALAIDIDTRLTALGY